VIIMRYYELTIITKKDLPSLPIQPVKEQRGPNFITLDFYAEPGKISELEKALKANSLRYMLLVKKPKREASPRRKPPIEKPPTFEKKVREKVDLDILDKKLKEILEQ